MIISIELMVIVLLYSVGLSHTLTKSPELADKIITCHVKMPPSGTQPKTVKKCRSEFWKCLKENGISRKNLESFITKYEYLEANKQVKCGEKQLAVLLIAHWRDIRTADFFAGVVQSLCSTSTAWNSNDVKAIVHRFKVDWPVEFIGQIYGFKTTVNQNLEVVRGSTFFLLHTRITLCQVIAKDSAGKPITLCQNYYLEARNIKTLRVNWTSNTVHKFEANEYGQYAGFTMDPTIRDVTKRRMGCIFQSLFLKQITKIDSKFRFPQNYFQELIKTYFSHDKIGYKQAAENIRSKITSINLLSNSQRQVTNTRHFSKMPEVKDEYM